MKRAHTGHKRARITGWQREYQLAEDELDDPRSLALPDWNVLEQLAGHGSLTATQRYLHPDQRSIIDAGKALSAHLAAS